MPLDSAHNGPVTDDDDDSRRRAIRFFWVVLIASSATSIAGNAIHAAVNATAVPAVLAAAVAICPPLVLLASTEGLSQLIKVRRRPSITYWAALIMTTMLAAAAFRLSFDALRDLAARCGVRDTLAWLWPVAVDVSMTQATVSLLALTRMPPKAALPADAADPSNETNGDEDEVPDDIAAQNDSKTQAPPRLEQVTSATAAGMERHTTPRYGEDAARVVATRRTKQPPEVVEAVLAAHEAGQSVTEIGAYTGLHHSTVSRIVANATRGLKTVNAR